MKPLLAIGAVALAGLLLTAALDRWRLGVTVLGLAFCVGAAVRLTVSSTHAGDLAVRSKAVDAAVLLVLGFGLVTLANALPAGH